MSRPLRGGADGRVNALVTAAAAQVAGHGFVDFGVGRRRFLGEKGGGLHDLPALAIAALRNAEIAPRHLDRMGALGVKALDRDDLLAGHFGHLDTAGADRLAVEVDRTGAAQRYPAAEFGPGQTKLVAQEPHERHRGVALEFPLLPIYLDVDHGLLLSTRLRRAHLPCLRMVALTIGVSNRKEQPTFTFLSE